MIIRGTSSYFFPGEVKVVSCLYNPGMPLCCAEWHVCVVQPHSIFYGWSTKLVLYWDRPERFLLTRDRPVGSGIVTRVNDSTRVTLRKTVTRLESLFSHDDSSHNQWLETRVRVIFAKSSSLWSTNPVCLRTKKWSFFGPVMIKIGANLFAFHRGAQYKLIDTSWSNQVFAYRDYGSRPHTVILSLFQMKWFKLFEYKSNAKIYSLI